MRNKVGDYVYDKSQLNRGILEGCILKIISVEEIYGYSIKSKLSDFGFKNINEGTIYPLLMRFEKKEFISSNYKVSPLGPKRKFFTITQSGIEMLNSFEEHWKEVSVAVNEILNLEEKTI